MKFQFDNFFRTIGTSPLQFFPFMHSPDMDKQVELVESCIAAKITLMSFLCIPVVSFHMAVISRLPSEILATGITFIRL